MNLETTRLQLALKTPDDIRQMVEAAPPEMRAQFSAEWLEAALGADEASPWLHGFRILRVSDGQEIGAGGFKGRPSPEGMVEVAYGIAPEAQGQGYATEAARALVEFALSDESVTTVWAHTLREQNASTSVLTKIGFRLVGDVVDPEDGPVWRWERTR